MSKKYIRKGEDDNFTRRIFEEKLLRWKERSVFSDELIIRDDSSWYDRGTAMFNTVFNRPITIIAMCSFPSTCQAYSQILVE